MENVQNDIVNLANANGYNRFHHDWFKNNQLNADTWLLECCLLQKWLREYHNIDLLIKPVSVALSIFPQKLQKQYCCNVIINQSFLDDEHGLVWQALDIKYQTALEEGIEKALTTINPHRQ